MKIHFFEEFPIKSNLKKLPFPAKVFVAAKNSKEFSRISIKNKIYWPILEEKDGYWFSALSDTKAIESFIDDYKGQQLMWDAEPPLLRLSLVFKDFFKIIKNRKLITNFLNKNKKVIVCELPPSNFFMEILYKFLILRTNKKKIFMLYTTFITKKHFEKSLSLIKNKYPNSMIGIGCIAKGITKHERVISEKELKYCLTKIKEHNFKEVVIYRLGGLNKKYLEVINEFI